MKFLVIGDIHYTLRNPKARKDDYHLAIEAKLTEAADIAKDHKVEAVLIPGDLFDSPTVSLVAITRLAAMLKKFPCPIYTIPGNHDSHGHNLSTIDRTPYGLLKGLGLIECLHYPIASKLEGVIITGHGFDTETDRSVEQYKTYISPGKNVRIHLVHGMLLDSSPGFDMRHTLVSQIGEMPKKDSPDILVCGHYHLGLSSQLIGDTLVVNPGALCRISAHQEEVERTPQVAILEVSEEGDCDVSFLALQSALPGHEVLSREHIEAQQQRSEQMEKFLKLLASEGESRFLEVGEIIEDISAREELPEEVKDDALARIGRAKEGMSV